MASPVNVSEPTASFGAWLRRRRRALDLTQPELARQVGCALITIQKIEADARRPSPEMAERLAECLAIAAEERKRFLAVARGELSALRLSPETEPKPSPARRAPALAPLPGRAVETGQLIELVLRGRHEGTPRLVTLSGPGGVGKTRLAHQVIAHLRTRIDDVIYFVDLAPLTAPHLVIDAIAQTLDVRSKDSYPTRQQVEEYLAQRRTVLVLDNFEQLLPAAPLLTELLAATPGLTLLVTSRERLRVQGEQLYPLAPLTVPPMGAAFTPQELLTGYACVQLFVAAAQAVEPTFTLDATNATTVAALCVRLDGLPLALELAAARTRLLSPSLLLAQLNATGRGATPWRILAGGRRDALPRHRSLWETIEWSYGLLSEGEQALFRRLAVFVGGATLEAVSAVCVLPAEEALEIVEGLASLLDKSLLRRMDGLDEGRVGMLETIRKYAQARLHDAGEQPAIGEAHARYFAGLAAAAALHLTGAQQVTWLDRLEAEPNNLRAALQWSLDHKQAAIGAALGAGLWHFWYIRGHHHEGIAWLNSLLALPTDDAQRAPLLHGLAMLTRRTEEYTRAERSAEDSLALCRRLEDDEGIAANLRVLGFLRYRSGDLAKAQALLEECLAIFRRLGNQEGVAAALTNLAYFVKDAAQARAYAEESLAIRRTTGNLHGISVVLALLGFHTLDESDYAAAVGYLEENLSLCRAIGNRDGEGVSLDGLSIAACARQDYAEALAYAEALRVLGETTNEAPVQQMAYLRLGAAHLLRGDTPAAIRAFDALSGLGVVEGNDLYVLMTYRAGLAVAIGQAEAALRLAGFVAASDNSLMKVDIVMGKSFAAAARARLPAAEADAAWAAGQAMNEAEITVLAQVVLDAAHADHPH